LLKEIIIILRKEIVEKHILENLAEGDKLVGFFSGISSPKFWWYLLIGPLAHLRTKTYFVAVSNRGVYFNPLILFNKFGAIDFFEFEDIKNVKIAKGFIQRSFLFQFKNGRKLKIQAPLFGKKGLKIEEDVQKYIENNISVIS